MTAPPPLPSQGGCLTCPRLAAPAICLTSHDPKVRKCAHRLEFIACMEQESAPDMLRQAARLINEDLPRRRLIKLTHPRYQPFIDDESAEA